MKNSKYFMIGALIMGGLVPSMIQSESFIDNSISEEFIVQPSDRIEDILKLANAYFQSNKSIEQGEKTYELTVASTGAILSPKREWRNYNNAVTKNEKKDVSHIVTSLANESLPNLLIKKSELKKVGDRIDHLHPLRFLGVIFTSEELKAGIHGIRERSWVWDEFSSGLFDNLTKESNAGNLTDAQISDFAKRVNIDVGIINPALQNRQWKQFINTLIDQVPRKATDRYKI